MDIVKKDIKKKKQKAKAKAKAKTKPTQTQTQKVIVNLQDVFKKKRKSPRKTAASTRVSAASKPPQVIYQPAPMALQPDLASIIREQLSKSMPQPTLTRSVVQQDVPQLTRTEAPNQLRSFTRRDIEDRPTILEGVDEGFTRRDIEDRPVILEEVDDDLDIIPSSLASEEQDDFQRVGVPMQEPEIRMETFEEKAKRGRGRPRGFKVTKETKDKTRKTKQKKRRQQQAASEGFEDFEEGF